MATLLWLSTLILMGNEGSLADVWPDFLGAGATVLATGPEHKRLAVNRTWRIEDVDVAGVDPGATRFGGPIQYGVAVAHGSFFVRTGNTLYCIRQAN